MSKTEWLRIDDSGEKNKGMTKREDVSWSNIHITNEFREGLLVEVFIQHPGQASAPWTEQRERAGKKRDSSEKGVETPAEQADARSAKGSRSLTSKRNIQEAKDSDGLISISWVLDLKQFIASEFFFLISSEYSDWTFLFRSILLPIHQFR